MATVYSSSGGAILRFLASAAEEAQWPEAPAGAAHTLTFDEDTNAPLVAALRTSTDAWRYDGTTLTQAGQVVPVAADGSDRTMRSQIDTWLAATQTYLGLNNPTAAQTTAQVARNARALAFVIRRLRPTL